MKPYVAIPGDLVPSGDCGCPRHHQCQDTTLIYVPGLGRLKNKMSCIVFAAEVDDTRKDSRVKARTL